MTKEKQKDRDMEEKREKSKFLYYLLVYFIIF